jgi:hypothetical protein
MKNQKGKWGSSWNLYLTKQKQPTKFELRVSEIVKPDQRIEFHEVDEKSISVQLVKGFNYEGRSGFYAFGITELKQMMKSIQAGESDTEE